MSTAVDNHSAAIRHDFATFRDPADPAVVARYALAASRWEELRLLAHLSQSTPDEDHKFRTLTPIVAALSEQLGLDTATEDHHGPDAVIGVTDFCGHLPTDLSCLLGETWQESAADWSGKTA